jgi:hypothetical protein
VNGVDQERHRVRIGVYVAVVPEVVVDVDDLTAVYAVLLVRERRAAYVACRQSLVRSRATPLAPMKRFFPALPLQRAPG